MNCEICGKETDLTVNDCVYRPGNPEASNHPRCKEHFSLGQGLPKDRGRQFVVRFKCGCCVRYNSAADISGPNALYIGSENRREHVKCDMLNGCRFSEEAVQKALAKRDARWIAEADAVDCEWGWEYVGREKS